MKLISKEKSNRWLVLDQSFFAMFITFSMIELANAGAGMIDGLIVSNFLDNEAMAAAGIAHPIFTICGIVGGMFATGMQTLCTKALGRGDVIVLDVRNEDDVSLVSQQIQLFCKGHKIDSTTGYDAAVCFEELAVNTIRHGFPNCKKDPGIDLRVVYDPRELIIRMQDNCPPFNVERQIAMTVSQRAEKPGEHLGMKILSGVASDIHYVHSLETNNVILRFPIGES